MTRDELQAAVEDAIDNATVSGNQIDAAIRIALGYPGECYDQAHAAIAKRIRALLPEGGK